jgi:hypothetical protein
MLSLFIVNALAIYAAVTPAHAQYQYPTANDGARIEFMALNEVQPLETYGSEPLPIVQEVPNSHMWWDHGVGQCCGDCPPGWRVRAEGLLLRYGRGDGLTLSNAGTAGRLDFESGGRISITRQLDCLDAWEFVGVGPFEWNGTGTAVGVGLASRLSSTTVNLSEFNNSTLHRENYRTQFNGAELNRRWNGWDVISTLAGVRYINIEENYLFDTIGPVGTGSLAIHTDNHMVGPQIGMELMYPVGRWMSTMSVKGGLMVNGTRGNLRLVNAGAVQIANSDRDLEVAALFELGYFASYQVTPRLRIRGGYEFWWLYGFADVPGQLANPVTTQTGAHLSGNSEVYYHGASAGVEFVW